VMAEGIDERAVENGRGYHRIRRTKDQIIYKLSEIRRQMLDGATNSEIMSNLNIPERTFYRYMHKIYQEDKAELAKENYKTLVSLIFLHCDRLLYLVQICKYIATCPYVKRGGSQGSYCSPLLIQPCLLHRFYAYNGRRSAAVC
jgi:DNA-binding CsgD family transcriptional regulator